MSKSKSTKQFPYDELHLFVAKEKKYRRWWVIVSVILSLLSFSHFQQISLDAEFNSVESILLALIASGGVVIVIMIIALIAENIDRSNNSKFTHRIIEEFRVKPHKFTEAEIDNIDRRASIGNSSGPMRTLLPLLAIPLSIPIIINGLIQFADWPELNIQDISQIFTLPITIILFLILSFLFELDRANTDVVIQHAISEHRTKQRNTQAIEQTTAQVAKQRESAVLRMLQRHDVASNQHPSQWSVTSTNGVGADDEVAHCPGNRL